MMEYCQTVESVTSEFVDEIAGCIWEGEGWAAKELGGTRLKCGFEQGKSMAGWWRWQKPASEVKIDLAGGSDACTARSLRQEGSAS
jgi:hypothetical protein